MKKFLIILGSVLILIIAAAVVLPLLFKDDIKAAIDKELQASINADVLFDVDQFSLSVFRNFPNITASMKEFGIINRAPFQGEILFAANELNVEINLFSLFGEKPSIKGINIDGAIINIKVLEDGSANYDIAIPSEETTPTDEEPAEEFTFGIDHWQVTNGEFIYDDATLAFYLKLENVNHSGSGDFSLDVFDLATSTQAESVTVRYEGDTYLDGQTGDIEALITISEDISRYTFKENKAKINDFALAFDGWFFMGSDFYDMDIRYSAMDNTFKSLLSLVPGMYTDSFADIKADGEISFEGDVKGKYTDTEFPSFNLALQIANAMFQYPDLPSAVNNIAMDLLIQNPDGIMENTSVELRQFHMDLGTNPLDATLKINNLIDYDMEAMIKTSLNLAELGSLYPIEGLEMRGTFNLDMNAKGKYDSTMATMPVLSGSMGLLNGYLKSSDFPIPLENFHFDATMANPTGKMKDFRAQVKRFSMKMDGEEFSGALAISNLVNYTWDVDVAGAINIKNMTAIFPLEGMELAGRIKANISTSGNYAALTAERYAQLPTSGTMMIEGFTYKDVTLPYDVTIKSASATLSPSSLALNSYTGTIGKSDISMKGNVNNYLGYLLSDNELLSGTFDFNAGYLDLNELMPESEADTSAVANEEAFSAIPVPTNLDFVLNSTIKKVHYMDMDLDNLAGQIVIRDGVATMKNLKFNTMGGSFFIGGTYDTKVPDAPKYNLSLKIDELSISESFKKFTVVKKLAPVAANIIGKVSTDFNISGELGQDLMPKMETISGGGILKVVEAAFGNTSVLDKLSTVTSLDKSDAIKLKNVALGTTIKDGRLTVKPFNMTMGEYEGSVAGSTGIDGSIDYSIKLNVPASKFGGNLTTLTKSIGLDNVNENSLIPLNIAMGGTYMRPTFNLAASGTKDQAKQVVTAKAKEEGTKVAKDLIKSLGDSSKVGGALNSLLGSKKDSLKSDSTKTDLKTDATEKAKSALKNLLKKKNNN